MESLSYISTAMGLNGPASFFFSGANIKANNCKLEEGKLKVGKLKEEKSCREFYKAQWQKGDVVKAKKTSEPSDLFVYDAVIVSVNPKGTCDIMYDEGNIRHCCPRSEIFPPSFTSAVQNAEKWSHCLNEDVLSLFMVDYPYQLKRTPNAHISSEILDFMFIGSSSSSADELLLKKLKIVHVLRVHGEPLPFWMAVMYERLNIHVHTIPIWDMADVAIDEHWSTALPFLHECRKQGQKVLVHCEAGRSRSGSIGLAYMMKYGAEKPLSLLNAMHEVRSCRDDVYPNPRFWQALLKYEKDLTGSMSMPLASVTDMHAYMYHYFD